MIRKILLPLLSLLVITACVISFPPKPGQEPAVAETEQPEFTLTPLLPEGTDTPQATDTLAPALTPTGVSSTRKPASTPTATPDLPPGVPVPERVFSPTYLLQSGTPAYSPNFLVPEAGCNWTGIGGQVFSVTQAPVTGLVVEVGGTLNGNPVLELTLTGNATKLGPGGFEIHLADQPVESSGDIYLQIFDVNGVPQTDQIFLDTHANCDQNLMIVNFTGVYTEFFYLPIIGKNAAE